MGKCETNEVFLFVCACVRVCVLILKHKDTKVDGCNRYQFWFYSFFFLKAAKVAFHCCIWQTNPGYLQKTCCAISQKQCYESRCVICYLCNNGVRLDRASCSSLESAQVF